MSRKIISIYFITTFGCQFNISDSERIKGLLNDVGLRETANKNEADVLIFNTCSVRQTAEDRVFGLNKELQKLKTGNKKLKIVLTGCMIHYERKKLKSRLPYVDFFLAIKELSQLPRMLGIKIQETPEDYLSFKPDYESKFRAYVPISSGCDNFCTYCIVPYARGREYSRPAEEIINEVKNLVKSDYKEIWLLGQNVNGYRSKIKDQKSKIKNTNQNSKLSNNEIVNFPDLLRIINAIPGDFWIRFTSPHPKDLSDDLIKTMAECKKITEYVNLPVQSGDNEILRKMNRPYTVGHYIKLVNKIRKVIPDIAISTDVIVGFPGETKKQFQNTVNLFEKIKFDMAYISEYSPRPGTAAAKAFKDNVLHQEKELRKKILTDILAETALANNKKLVGKTLDVLIDEKKEIWRSRLQIERPFGRTRGNKVVEIKNSPTWLSNSQVGNFVKVKILKAEPWKLKGELL